MSRSYRLTDAHESLSKRHIVILEENGVPKGTAVEKHHEDARRIIDQWMEGRSADTIKGVACNEAR